MTTMFSLLAIGTLAISFAQKSLAQYPTYTTVKVGYLPAVTQVPVTTTVRYTPPPATYYQRPYQTPAPYTFQPDNRNRYGSAASASGQGARAGGSASSGGAYDPRSGQQQSYGQASGYAGAGQQPRQPSRYDPYGQQQPRYDPRQPQRTDPRYTTRAPYRPPYQPPAPVDYSRYPPTIKSLVLSETGIYLWWTDPLVQYGGQRRGQSQADSGTKYTVKYSKLSGQASEEQTEETSSKELHLKTLEPGTDYRFWVKINRNGQETGWSAPVVNRTLEQLPLAPPTNIQVVPTDRDARITISPPEGFKGSVRSYIFLYAASGGHGGTEERKWEEIQISGGHPGSPDATQVLPRLEPGEEYFYTVQAVNSRGNSPFSEIQSFKTLPGPVYQTAAPYNPYAGRPTQAPYPDPYGPDAYNPDQNQQSPDAGGDVGYEDQTTPDYYAQYTTAPEYEQNTPNQYGRYPDAATPDYYGRYPTTEDYYAQFSTPPDYSSGDDQQATDSGHAQEEGQDEQSTDASWSPFWAAATQPSNGEQDPGAADGQPEPPSDLRVEPLEDPSEALVTYTPSPSSGLSEYEIRYTYDPTVADELWQLDTALSEENQAILARLTPNTVVYIKVRAKSPSGYSAFTDTVQFSTSASGDANRPDGDQDQDASGSQAQGEHDDDETVSVDEADSDTAHARTNRT